MKKLNFNHQTALQILDGQITTTWRLYDDKDLTVNDDVALIDQVDPQNAATWKAVGLGRINKIIEKRMGDIDASDYTDSGNQPHDTPEARLQAYRALYGDRVTWDTPVKMIHFDFTPGKPENGRTEEEPRQPIGERVILYADGGSRGNPGPSACGYVLLNEAEEVLVDKGVYLGITTNNQAEYQGLKSGLEEARRMGAREVSVRLDSLLVVNQMKGTFKVKNRDLWPIHQTIKELAAGFRKISYTHVPREMNKLADAAVNRVLDEAASVTRPV